jgi:hypothetical protein
MLTEGVHDGITVSRSAVRCVNEHDEWCCRHCYEERCRHEEFDTARPPCAICRGRLYLDATELEVDEEERRAYGSDYDDHSDPDIAWARMRRDNLRVQLAEAEREVERLVAQAANRQERAIQFILAENQRRMVRRHGIRMRHADGSAMAMVLDRIYEEHPVEEEVRTEDEPPWSEGERVRQVRAPDAILAQDDVRARQVQAQALAQGAVIGTDSMGRVFAMYAGGRTNVLV